jgi:transposase InsO family protein
LALEEHPVWTERQWEHVEGLVEEVEGWSGWPKRQILRELGVSRSRYYRRRSGVPASLGSRGNSAAGPGPPHGVLPEERKAVIAHALGNPNLRHRELAWDMVDKDVAYLSPSTVYRTLREAGLVVSWGEKRRKRYREDHEKAWRPDERWQSDIRQVKVKGKEYFLVFFLDEYSRYLVHQELMCFLDQDTVSLEAQRAIEKLSLDRKPCSEAKRILQGKPIIQTDNGSGYIGEEFKRVLSEHGLTHVRIRPHCPEENGLVERAHRTFAEVLDEMEFRDLGDAREKIAKIGRWYNEERLHSALYFLRPVDYYRGNPAVLLEERRRKLAQARHRRRERNLEIKQQTIAWDATESETRHALISEPICLTS